jgi:IPT/TIG domain
MKTRQSAPHGLRDVPLTRGRRRDTRVARALTGVLALSSGVLVGAIALAGPVSAATHGRNDPGAPTVTSVSPNEGETIGGSWVTVTGTGFDASTTVVIGQGDGPDVGSVPAEAVIVDSSTQIEFETGGNAIAGTFHTFVTTTAGTSDHSPDDLYTYVPPVT